MKKSDKPTAHIGMFYWVPDERRVEDHEGTQLGHIHHWRYFRKRLATVCRASDGVLICYMNSGEVDRIVTNTKVVEKVLDYLPIGAAA